MYDEEWKKMGINVKHIDKVNFIAKDGAQGLSQDEAMRKGLLSVDTSDIDWADIVMFRRYYNCSAKCNTCGAATKDPAAIQVHPHKMEFRDAITEWMWPAFESATFNKAVIYETDDNHFQIRKWNGYWPDVQAELPLIQRMARRADLVTVSTGPIKDAYSHLNENIRVIRNAIDPSIYTTSRTRPEYGGERPRVVYYGSTARMRDYGGHPNERGKWEGGYAGKGIQDLRKELWNVFIGVNPGTDHVIAPFFDEAYPYVENIRQFAETLAGSHGDIGIAPLGGDDFDRCKSELHWLEYAMVGAAFIGEGFKYGEAPYSMVNHGVDGLVVRGRQQWFDAVKSLVRSKDLRDQLAGAAKERVLKEYDYKDRAKEWADAFKWAVEHKGIWKNGRRDTNAA
jgi:glycosyltransferase involved in cell wall biosynthesis